MKRILIATAATLLSGMAALAATAPPDIDVMVIHAEHAAAVTPISGPAALRR